MEGRDEMGWLRHMYDGARVKAEAIGYALPEFDAFWRDGHFRFPPPQEDPTLLADYRRDPENSRLRTPTGRIELFSSTVDGFGYDDCPGHPTWIEPAEWLKAPLAQRFPFHLLSNQPSRRLHSQLDPAPESRRNKVADREALEISRQDAETRGLRDGDIVRVFNDRGSLLAGVRIVDDLFSGVLILATGAWYDPEEPGQSGSLEKHGNPNVLTLDKGSSRLAQSIAVQTALVDIELVANPPPVTAFDLPKIVSAW
jgi:biotin/methionine sulfoxide reductase